MLAASRQEVSTRDTTAFVALVEPVLPAAYRLGMAMLRSETDAEDAVQEAMFRAWRNFERFKTNTDVKPWLLAIVANECRRQRANRWWSVIKSSSRLGADRPQEAEPSARAAELRRAVGRLPHDQRLVLALRYYLDLSFAEVGQVLKISPKAAKSRTYRALERLRLSPEVLGDE